MRLYNRVKKEMFIFNKGMVFKFNNKGHDHRCGKMELIRPIPGSTYYNDTDQYTIANGVYILLMGGIDLENTSQFTTGIYQLTLHGNFGYIHQLSALQFLLMV